MSEYKTLFEKLAQDRNISVEEMRSIIAARIETGISDPDPVRRAQWEKIPHTGDVPSPEEWLRYVVEKLEEEGCLTCCAGIRTFEWVYLCNS